jgi:hypothetical protein
MSMNVLYKTAARVTGGRDGTFEVSLTTPKELGGPGGDGANPEKLFAAVGGRRLSLAATLSRSFLPRTSDQIPSASSSS